MAKLWHQSPAPMQPLDVSAFEQQVLAARAAGRLDGLDDLIGNADLHELQRLLADGRLTCELLVLHSLDRILRFDIDRPGHVGLHSVAAIDPDALAVARERDAQRAEGSAPTGALHGIPVLVKDNIATRPPVPTTVGSRVLQGAVADRDATIVQRLREAGAVVLGKAALSEFAFYLAEGAPSGFSALAGQVRNPHGDFDCGGSSSGSGVAVAAGIVPLALGTETTGSLVNPGSHNSVWALRPSNGLVSRDRVVPISSRLDSAGPMARTVTGLAALLTAIAGQDARDSSTTDAPVADYLAAAADTDALAGTRFAIVEEVPEPADQFELPEQAVTSSVHELFERMTARLTAAGASTSRARLPIPADAWRHEDVMRQGFRDEVTEYLRETRAPVSSVAELAAEYRRGGKDWAPFGSGLVQAAAESELEPDDVASAFEHGRDEARAMLDGILAESDAVLAVGASASVVHAFAGYPALAMPAGRLDTGEPVGLTAIAGLGRDADLIRIAASWEAAFPDLHCVPVLVD